METIFIKQHLLIFPFITPKRYQEIETAFEDFVMKEIRKMK
jgi:hypothetical protein